MEKNISSIIEKEWEDLMKLHQTLNKRGYFVPLELVSSPPFTEYLAKEILSPDVSGKIVVGYIHPKVKKMSIFSSLEPVKIVLLYPALPKDDCDQRRLDRILKFRDFLDSEKIPYEEKPSREEKVKDLKNGANLLLEYAKRIEGK